MSMRCLLGGAIALALVLSGTTPARSQGPANPPGQGRFLDVIVVLDPAFAPGGHAANQAAARRVARGLGVARQQAASALAEASSDRYIGTPAPRSTSRAGRRSPA